jgi:hypothetical protein
VRYIYRRAELTNVSSRYGVLASRTPRGARAAGPPARLPGWRAGRGAWHFPSMQIGFVICFAPGWVTPHRPATLIMAWSLRLPGCPRFTMAVTAPAGHWRAAARAPSRAGPRVRRLSQHSRGAVVVTSLRTCHRHPSRSILYPASSDAGRRCVCRRHGSRPHASVLVTGPAETPRRRGNSHDDATR